MSLADDVLGRLRRRRAIEAPVALVAAHPDDEVIGAGASLRLFQRLLLVHVTDGAPANGEDARAAGFATPAAYAGQRRRELYAALRLGGAQPARAALGAQDQAASLRMAELAEALVRLLRAHGTRLVVAHPYEGGHPDHDAACWIAHAAAARLGLPVLEMASYHAGADGGRRCGGFLGDAEVVAAGLGAEERALRRAMLGAFVTQGATLTGFEDAGEVFRAAPAYDFAQAPHEGTLHYERYDWGMDGARWRAMVPRG
ncbi:MAG: PIG-L deacetylase family protein [Janthinobacterium lividum]